MNAISSDLILDALRKVVDPATGRDIVSAGMISGLQTTNGDVLFMIEVDPARGPALEPLRQQAENIVRALPGIRKVTAILTAEREAENARAKPAPGPALPGIRNIIAVASGKGGVGKSTIAVNLAVALGKLGYKTGLLDADIYGPSVPKMMGLEGKKPIHSPPSPPVNGGGYGAETPPRERGGKGGGGGTIIPLAAYGVKVMSIGFLIDAAAPLIWRGPMVQSAILQLLRDVEWGDLDFLIVDMPPGTGDAQLTMAQKVPLAGAIIVSTPQDIALIDARKGLEMFRKVNVPVLGIIENMSYYACPACGHADNIFGHGGAKAEAAKLGCEFLGEIPLRADIRKSGDAGIPALEEEIFKRIGGEISEILIRGAARRIG